MDTKKIIMRVLRLGHTSVIYRTSFSKICLKNTKTRCRIFFYKIIYYFNCYEQLMPSLHLPSYWYSLGMDDIPVSARMQAAARRWALDLGIEPEKVKTRTPRFTAKTRCFFVLFIFIFLVVLQVLNFVQSTRRKKKIHQFLMLFDDIITMGIASIF